MRKIKSKPAHIPPKDRHEKQKSKGWADVLLRLNPQDVADLDAVAAVHDLKRTDTLRLLVREAAIRHKVAKPND